MTIQKPVAPACERNRQPILSIIKPILLEAKNVLEIGSGTGQHAVYFAKHMPWLKWQCSDVEENLAGINMWIDEAKLDNLVVPIELDVETSSIEQQYDAIYSCNTLHIMSKNQVEDFFQLVASVTIKGADLIIYGPFNYNGSYTADSNAAFDQWLKEQNPASSIRDFEWVTQLANNIGFELVNDYPMPANNRCLHWQCVR